MHIERFAPSPTGPLHLGHAYSAWLGWSRARDAGGRFLLRLEDLDTSRVRSQWAAQIEDDLRWLGLDWDPDVLCQSSRLDAYAQAATRLTGLGLTYACTCARRDIQAAISAPQGGDAPLLGPDGVVYPGTCRALGLEDGTQTALRLDVGAALACLGETAAQLVFTETGAGPQGETGARTLDPAALRAGTGDIVLRRRDGSWAYHLAVVVDDAWQQVSHVTRGEDLFPAVPIQRLLQALLGLPTPVYHHHRLVRDPDGRRLAKRDDARAIATYRAEGLSPAEVLTLAGVVSPALP